MVLIRNKTPLFLSQESFQKWFIDRAPEQVRNKIRIIIKYRK